MQIEIGWEAIRQDLRSVVTVGTFDGVHQGHEAIVRFLIERAQQMGGRSTVVTFDPHPREVLTGKPISLLTTIEERAKRLEKLGLDRLVVLPFTHAFSETPPEAYVKTYLLACIGCAAMVVGYDHHFGRNRAGNLTVLQGLGAKLGFETFEIPAQMIDHELVSSTAIRNHLAAGEVLEANRLLGYPYFVQGLVFKGKQLGRTIGFPTANLRINDPRKLLPQVGSYAVTAALPDGRVQKGMAYIGTRPSVATNGEVWLEVNLFDFQEDLYHQTLQVAFHAFIRPDERFPSLELLVDALRRDQEACLAVLESLF